MKLKTVKSFLAAAIATAAALVSTVASAYDDGVLSTPDDTVVRKGLGGDRYAYVFTNASAATTATLGRNAVLIEALVIGGGGGGGGRAASSGHATGGGGAGGFAYYPELGDALASGTVIDIRVGAGGEGGLGSLSGSNGGESSLVVAGRSFVVPGGGGGAKGFGTGNLGSEGGSGGGGSGQNAGGPGLTGFGFAGAPGKLKNGDQAGGGGGAGGPGLVYASKIGGAGGPGRYCAITGENLCYAGGGAPSNGRAGEGGGGTPNVSGTDGFGGGGGGATTSDAAAGAGGAGTVIIVLAARDGLVAEAIPAQPLTIGVPCEPHPTVRTMGGTALTEDQDYVLSWTDNTSVGRATVTVQGIGSYSGMFDRVPFEIEMDQFSDEFIETSDVTCRRLVVGDRHVYIFTNTFSQVSVTVKSALLLDSALIVAGGGGGGIGGNGGTGTSAGIGGGGGGGAGGVIAVTNAPAYMSASSTLNLSVGFGGAGSSDPTKRGASGGNSILSYGDVSLVAVGGGGGGCDKKGAETAGSVGGSGGGGAYTGAGGAGTEEQGCAGSGGAAASSNHYAGGGGGAGGPGEASVTAYCVNTKSGNGGPGVTNDITGVEVCYAGGGGGGGANGFTAGGLGGIGGGAEGGCSSAGYDGANGLGGGGGGGGCDATKVGQAGGSGGSGVVILSFSRLPIAVADIPVQLFVGAPVEPEVTVTDVKTSAVLTPGEDYEVAYANNTGVGTGTATVTGLGKYEGVEISVDFVIELGIQIPEIPAQALVAGGARPKLVLVNRVTGATLVEGQDYELIYADNEAPGTATVTIQGLDAYESITVVRTFEVVLALMVTPDATGSGDGHTWESPMTFNQAKVAVLATGGEIWLKEGTYAFEGEPESIGANDCAVCIRGGYAGLSGTSADAREGAKSTLSGEDAYDTLTLTNAAEVTLQRLVITRGLNHGLAKTSGSGSVTLEDCEIRNNGSQRAKLEGGRGLYVLGCNTLTIRRCVFAGNVVGEADFDVATTGGNEYGTAMYAQNCALVMSDTAFVTNGIPAGKPAETVFRRSKCFYYGAALYLSTVSSATLSGCSFVANRAPSVRDSFGYSQGAILYFTQCSSVSFANCLVAGNSVIGANTDSGCGNVVYFTGNKSNTLSIDSCTFAYNLIRANTSLIGGTPAKATVVNSVFYGNVGDATATAPRDLDCGMGGVTLGYSLFAGTGGENIAAGVTKTDGVIAGDPLFVTSPDDFLALVENENPALDRMTWPYRFNPEKIDELVNIDCHLLSAQGYVDNAGVQHTAPGKKSPAIDAGDPANGAWVNEPGANGGRLNAGRYAGTAEASQTPKPGVPEIDPEDVKISFPNEYTQPQIDFTMGGEGVYLASVRIFCGTGELARAGAAYSWSTEFAGVANGDDVSWKLPGYVGEGEQVYYAIVVTSDGRTQKPVAAEVTAEGTCPPWAGKGGGANVMHVRAGADGASDGSDWSNAYPDLCAALDSLTPEKTEVWVAGETPVSPTTLVQSHPVSRDIVIRGGFGGTENSLSERPAGTRTVIDQSGEKLGLQLTLMSGANVRLERFRFVGASARALSVTHGGASLVLEDCEILNNVMGVAVSGSGAGSVSITNCLFAGNLANDSYTAAVSGRALSVKNCTRLTLDDCLFATNGVTAAYVDAPHSTCDVGAALFLQDAKVTARNVRFVGNRVRRIIVGSTTGGGICRLEYSDGNSPAKIADSAFTNCLWVGNEERRYVNCKSAQGGGMVWLPANVKASGTAVGDITFANCTFACNLSVGGGNAQGDTTAAGINVSANRVIVRNSIFYANMIRKDTFCGSDICAKGDVVVDVDYSLFEGNGTNWVTGAGVAMGSHNVYGSPRFVTTDAEFLATIDKAGEGSVSRWDGEPAFNAEATDRICAFNVHLRGRFGYYDEVTGEKVMDYLYPRSPAVDAGDPTSDYSREPKPNGWRINMGVYGNTPWATMVNSGLLIMVQ